MPSSLCKRGEDLVRMNGDRLWYGVMILPHTTAAERFYELVGPEKFK